MDHPQKSREKDVRKEANRAFFFFMIHSPFPKLISDAEDTIRRV